MFDSRLPLPLVAVWESNVVDAAEAFFSTFEHEVLSRHHFATKAQAREAGWDTTAAFRPANRTEAAAATMARPIWGASRATWRASSPSAGNRGLLRAAEASR